MENLKVGIDDIEFYVGKYSVDVAEVAKARGIYNDRFSNLLMKKKSLQMPFEDSVSVALNAAKKLVSRLSPEEKNRIDLLVAGTESGVDHSKSISTYLHRYLGLNNNCRLFEIKHACFGGTSSLFSAIGHVGLTGKKDSLALVISTDVPKMDFELSQGVGGVAMLVSKNPRLLEINYANYGSYCFEVMDTYRPNPRVEIGNGDLSLLSYIKCFENSYLDFDKLNGKEGFYQFQNIVMHCPFPGMVKGAHRALLRKLGTVDKVKVEDDFNARVSPSTQFGSLVGNIYSGSVFMSLCSLISTFEDKKDRNIGVFSYGSGCSSMFYKAKLKGEAAFSIKDRLKETLSTRVEVDFARYDKLRSLLGSVDFEAQHLDFSNYKDSKEFTESFSGKEAYVISKIEDYYRTYEMV